MRVLSAEYTASLVVEADRCDLMPIGVGVETEAVGDSQSGAPERSEVCRLGSESRRVDRFLARQRDDEAAGSQPTLDFQRVPTPKRNFGYWALGIGSWRYSLDVIPIARHRIDYGDLLDREVGDDLDLVLVDDEHLFDADPPAEQLAVLGLEGEHHSGLDLDRVIERPDARDDRGIVLRETEPVAPQVGRCLIFFSVAPRLFR